MSLCSTQILCCRWVYCDCIYTRICCFRRIAERYGRYVVYIVSFFLASLLKYQLLFLSSLVRSLTYSKQQFSICVAYLIKTFCLLYLFVARPYIQTWVANRMSMPMTMLMAERLCRGSACHGYSNTVHLRFLS